jgi:hypothetical protein
MQEYKQIQSNPNKNKISTSKNGNLRKPTKIEEQKAETCLAESSEEYGRTKLRVILEGREEGVGGRGSM